MRELSCCQHDDANAAAQQGLSELLLRLGHGREPVHTELGENMIQLPPALCAATDELTTLLEAGLDR